MFRHNLILLREAVNIYIESLTAVIPTPKPPPSPFLLWPSYAFFLEGGLFHKRLLLVSCSVSVVVIQSSTQCQQTFPCCTVCLVWLALGATDIPHGHVSRVTFFFFFGQSGLASWWRVCYQRGIPSLVYISICVKIYSFLTFTDLVWYWNINKVGFF